MLPAQQILMPVQQIVVPVQQILLMVPQNIVPVQQNIVPVQQNQQIVGACAVGIVPVQQKKCLCSRLWCLCAADIQCGNPVALRSGAGGRSEA